MKWIQWIQCSKHLNELNRIYELEYCRGWALGIKLPYSRDFAVFYRSSVNIVEKAIEELTSKDLLIRDNRRGTFVATGLRAEFPPSGCR
ncbi:GntR family transcriptional regulator [Paenibacillus sp. RC67]|uniref:GntR family transcriptional regulator n=1 Tax=Paenibacillus sp. RC67 TaxID=3039392 RepID=UPI0024AE50BB|nr:GntR family transcriptional regulator [Paenibacillus sp. RC67]